MGARLRSATRRRRLVLATAAAVIGLTLASRVAQAHEIGLSRGEYVVAGSAVTAELAFSRREVTQAATALDADHDGAVTEIELAAARGALEWAIVGGVAIAADGAPCPGTLEEARLADEDGIVLRATYRCPAAPARLRISLTHLEDWAFGHRHVAHVAAGAGAVDQVMHRRSPSLEVDLAAPAGDTGAPSRGSIAWSFFVQGVEHIVTGLDHLAFLFGLILLGGRLRSILAMVTAFTVAHSITLALAVLGVWTPSARLIEPAIALSVAYVGLENWFVKDAAKRWRITFPFGLVHGFGFAGALGAIALPRPEVPIALLTFNLGVEAGQAALLAPVLPLVLLARKHEWFKTTGVKALSAGVALAGLVWFVARVAGA